MDDRSEHEKEGYAARESGVQLKDNPYDWFTAEWREWHDGWQMSLSDEIDVSEKQTDH